MARRVVARQGSARTGLARLGMSEQCMARQGQYVVRGAAGWFDSTHHIWPKGQRQGMARPGVGAALRGLAWQGWERRGAAWRGLAWLGWAGPGEARTYHERNL